MNPPIKKSKTAKKSGTFERASAQAGDSLAGNAKRRDETNLGRGRPSSYSPEIAERICSLIAASDRSIHRICQDEPDLPAPSTVFLWLTKHKEFSDLYARAKEFQTTCVEEGMLDIADDGRNDWMQRLAFNGGNPSWEVNGEVINRSRLRIDTRKWVLAKLKPRKYGDRVVQEHQGSVDPDAPPVAIKVVFVKPDDGGKPN